MLAGVANQLKKLHSAKASKASKRSRRSSSATPPFSRSTSSPTYKPEYAQIAFRHALLGATDQDLAAAFAVTERTINAWKTAHPDFLAALRAGKDEADAKVAECLFKRATGYDQPDTHFSTFKGEVIATPCVKHHPPEIAAMVFWLKSRKPHLFRDKPNVNITVNNDAEADLDKPLEEWGPREIEAELQRRGVLATDGHR